MQSPEKFMADLLAIVASTQDSEDQQMAAAKKLSTAYAADLRAWIGKWVGKVSGDQTRRSLRSKIDTARNPAPGVFSRQLNSSSGTKRPTFVYPRGLALPARPFHLEEVASRQALVQRPANRTHFPPQPRALGRAVMTCTHFCSRGERTRTQESVCEPCI